MSTTLIIKHFPKELNLEDRCDFLKHFGANDVQCMSDNGPLKYSAFAHFPNRTAAADALKRLHQLELLGRRINAEFSKSGHTVLNDPTCKGNEDKNDDIANKRACKKSYEFDDLHKISKAFDIDYPFNPNLCYLYPEPDATIIANIGHAIASVPSFYYQVLHLMNKMNLPAPFGAKTAPPPMKCMSESEESELESDEETKTLIQPKVKRKKKQIAKENIRKPKLILDQPVAPPRSMTAPVRPEDVFETLDPIKKPVMKPVETQVKDTGFIQTEPAIGGFGKIEPVTKKDDDHPEDVQKEEELLTKFITMKEIDKNRMSKSELKSLSVFRNYEPGIPSTRLYVKNLHKSVTENDLKYIFGRYVDWNDENESNMFDIRLMKEGRMKGQAFVNLPSEQRAERAVTDLLGYVLQSKPMVIMYGRSAKPKEQD